MKINYLKILCILSIFSLVFYAILSNTFLWVIPENETEKSRTDFILVRGRSSSEVNFIETPSSLWKKQIQKNLGYFPSYEKLPHVLKDHIDILGENLMKEYIDKHGKVLWSFHYSEFLHSHVK